MRVLLVGNYLADGQESMQRFADALLEGVRRRGMAVQLIRPSRLFGRLGASSHSGLGKWLGYFDKFVLFPWRLKRELRVLRRAVACAEGPGGVVVHVCDHSNACYTRHLGDVAHVVTCHDLLAVRSARGEFSNNPTRWSGRCLQAMILRGLNRAQHVACVSHATESDLMRISALKREQVSVVANSLNYPYSPMPAAEAHAHADRCVWKSTGVEPGPGFVLHVGGNQWYKNRLGVLHIYARLCTAGNHAPSLVLVGEPLSAEMDAFIREARLEDRVFRVQSCSNEELRALYSLAGALLFPSLAEGFGWPVIEAQACGCPVVCSSVSPLPEVAGAGACLCEPGHEPGFADAVQRLIADAAFRSETIARGLANAERFQPEAMISQYVDCYAELVKATNSARELQACVASPLPV